MDTKDTDQARKLSNAEMESQKAGATFAKLDRFVVKAISNRNVFAGFNPAADTQMCAGQTRSGDITTNPAAQIRDLSGLAQVRLTR